MTETLHAADSAYPQPSYYSQFSAWGVYVAGAATHVWTRAEVAELHVHGIEGALPIAVPPQSWPWIMPEETVMSDLCRECEAWGVPKGSPVALDVEEKWAERMGSQLPNVIAIWAGTAEAAGFVPWVYGSYRTLAARAAGAHVGLWLAEWPAEVPTDPELPAGYAAWQYAGGVDGDKLDLDLIATPVALMATNFSEPSGLVHYPIQTEEKSTVAPLPTNLTESEAAHVAAAEGETVAVEAHEAQATTAADTELGKVADAATAESTEVEKISDAPVTSQHLAELDDLATTLETRAKQVRDLRNQLAAVA